MIEVKGLTKTFGENQVLRGISETIRKGEKVAVIGPSGSGKSTFLRCLNLLETPTAGQIFLEDAEHAAAWAWCFNIFTCFHISQCAKILRSHRYSWG